MLGMFEFLNVYQYNSDTNETKKVGQILVNKTLITTVRAVSKETDNGERIFVVEINTTGAGEKVNGILTDESSVEKLYMQPKIEILQ
jgi:hypothetical protein